MNYIFYLYAGDELIGTRTCESDNPEREARRLRKGRVTRVEWEEA